ncbi:MAG: OmpH family outer membrane protein [Saprospiraceae bacterium]|nr:OmpH family outer membrane protein [Saprospiraceae bacterium]
MTKYFLTLLLMSTMTLTSFGQRFAIVDVSGILDQMPEYEEAQNQLDKIAANWRQEIAEEYDEIKSLYNKYQAEQVLLSDEAREEREEEIMEREKRVRELQKQRFGPDGDLFRRRQELVQPIQEKVYNAIEEYADLRGYDAIFDKSGSAGIIYAGPELEKTDDILRSLDLK